MTGVVRKDAGSRQEKHQTDKEEETLEGMNERENRKMESESEMTQLLSKPVGQHR